MSQSILPHFKAGSGAWWHLELWPCWWLWWQNRGCREGWLEIHRGLKPVRWQCHQEESGIFPFAKLFIMRRISLSFFLLLFFFFFKSNCNWEIRVYSGLFVFFLHVSRKKAFIYFTWYTHEKNVQLLTVCILFVHPEERFAKIIATFCNFPTMLW